MNKVKVYGERNTGTNYLEKLMLQNFDVEMLEGAFAPKFNRWPLSYEIVRDLYFKIFFYRNLGWKHAMAPMETYLQESVTSKIVFLTLTKNPYTWLLSMFKRPYHTKAKLMDFESFLMHPYAIVGRENHADAFITPIEMWNRKNQSYLELMTYSNGLNLKYEDFLVDPERQVERVKDLLQLPFKSGEFVNLTRAAKKQDDHLDFEYYKDYYLNKKWSEKLTVPQINIINEKLDSEVMQAFGYDYISSASRKSMA